MLTKAERDEIRARTVRCDKLADLIGGRMMGAESHFEMLTLLDDLDAQDAEVARLTAENDRLIAVEMQSTWESLYWAEHDAVADREATIMAERASSAAMRRAVENFFARLNCYHCEATGALQVNCPNCDERSSAEGCCRCQGTGAIPAYLSIRGEARLKLYDDLRASLQSEAGEKLLADHAEEMAERTKQRDEWAAALGTASADIETLGAKLAAYRKALEYVRSYFYHRVKTDNAIQWEMTASELIETAMQSPDPGKALLDAHAAELAEARKIADCWAKAESGLNEMGMERDALRQQSAEHAEELKTLREQVDQLFDQGERDHTEMQTRFKAKCAESDALRQRAEAAEARATCDGSTERSHAESTKAAIAALWETNPEIAYESPAQVIAWLKGRSEAAELFCATFERPRGLRSGQCCDPVIDGEICALLRRVEASETALAKIAVRLNITPESDIALLLDVRLKRYERDSNVLSAAELRRAVFDLRAELRAMADRLAERALGGEGK